MEQKSSMVMRMHADRHISMIVAGIDGPSTVLMDIYLYIDGPSTRESVILGSESQY